MKTAAEERAEILQEVERRIAEYRLGGDTYPDLHGAADLLQDLADWLRARA